MTSANGQLHCLSSDGGARVVIVPRPFEGNAFYSFDDQAQYLPRSGNRTGAGAGGGGGGGREIGEGGSCGG